MLNPKDFRIGNWVNHKKENKPYQIQTLSIHPENRDMCMVLFGFTPHCTLDDVEPVLISPEILEANGFFNCGYGFTKRNSYGDIVSLREIYSPYGTGNIGFVYRVNYPDGLFAIRTLKYVHDLQNIFYILRQEELEINLAP